MAEGPVGSAPRHRLRVTGALTDTEVGRILDLADAAARTDGVHPLCEHVVLHLRHHGGHAQHVLAEDPGGALLGYAHLDLSDPGEGPSAELAVSPQARGQGVGGALLDEVVGLAAGHPGPLRLWAHGTEAPASRLAITHGFTRIRRLWQMRRSLYAPLPAAQLPPDVAVRPFDAGADAEAWLALNARAFPHLPDQGSWTRRDLDRRLAEPWFDPSGFLLAVDPAGALVGFHWTKVHAHQPGDHHQHEPIGEVYVVGVAPEQRGRGLGRGLTLAGLHHLRQRGLSSAMLYVDADNAAAIAVYAGLGFTPWDTDVMFRDSPDRLS